MKFKYNKKQLIRYFLKIIIAISYLANSYRRPAVAPLLLEQLFVMLFSLLLYSSKK
jgi:hypothetical protein